MWRYQNKPALTHEFLKELNFYAVHMLSPAPGAFRHEVKINVNIKNTPHTPPKWGQVPDLLEGFFDELQKLTADDKVFEAAAYALWRLNWIHPFAQGNGRTSRALSYFILCQHYELWLPGRTILPELIKRHNNQYYKLLQAADSSHTSGSNDGLNAIAVFLEELLYEQLSSVNSGS